MGTVGLEKRRDLMLPITRKIMVTRRQERPRVQARRRGRRSDLEAALRELWAQYDLGDLVKEIEEHIYGEPKAAAVLYPSFEWDGDSERGRLYYEPTYLFESEKDDVDQLGAGVRPFSIALEWSFRIKLTLQFRSLLQRSFEGTGTVSLSWDATVSKECVWSHVDEKIARLLLS